MFELRIGPYDIGENNPTFIIAEIGNNHNGSYERAIEMIDLAVNMGAQCAKFQIRKLESVYRKKSLAKTGDDLNAEYTIDLLKRFELSAEEHKKLAAYCESKNILYMCTPWDFDSVQHLESIGVKAYKVASADLTNIPLIDALIDTKKPLILSTGMSSEKEILTTVEHLKKREAQFAILHCNSTYPAPFHHIQLKFIERLKEIHDIVGYSGHERGIAVSLAAVVLGAKIIERHFTLDRTMEGTDHAASLEYHDFKALIEGIRQIESAMGSGKTKVISQGEMMNRENLSKSLVAAKNLKKGTLLTKNDISVRSPGQGLSPQYLDQLIGTTLQRDVLNEEYFYLSDIKGENIKVHSYKFKRPWGIPVRYFDFEAFNKKVRPDFYEFHLSYSDMDLKISDFFNKTFDYDFVVHAPELFAGSHLMDLSTQDDDYRNHSIKETQRVINITRELKNYFPKTKRPLIIANVGGFSMDAVFSQEKKEKLYDRFAKSLEELDLDGVELTPQTMAPFPWHFGGQRYQNLFVLPDETVKVCKKLGLRMCVDVSHTKLAANHFKINDHEFFATLAPVTAHLHLADAQGLDGEGLQVGEGELDFADMAKIFNELAPKASFIPEVWQGHKNEGEGFWIALERLQKYF